MILNKRYKTSNGLTMIQSIPLNWKVEKESKFGKKECFTIYVGNIATGHMCVYKAGVLSISYTSYSSTDPTLIFKINNLESAGIIVKAFADGMGISFDNTIYK